MKLNRRQLRRLIESAIYEQELDKGMSKGEKEDAKQENDAREHGIVEAILAVLMSYLDLDRSYSAARRITKSLIKKAGLTPMPTGDEYFANMSTEERLEMLDDTLDLYIGIAVRKGSNKEVICNKVGLEYMKGDTLANLGFKDKPGNLGDFLKDEIGYSNLKKYPHIYALYQANA